VDLLPLVGSAGLASGVNAYIVLLTLGLLGRFGGVDSVPELLQNPAVMLVAAVMVVVEFVADKVPYLDSLWDGVSTLIRPAVGAALGYLLADQAGSGEQVAWALLGGGSALASHSVKTGTRLAVNASPEPVSNTVVSLGEDVSVVAVVLLAAANPWLAFALAMALLFVGAIVVVALFRLVRRGWRRRRARDSAA
jgi:Domain of unknown function (DUF4126)